MGFIYMLTSPSGKSYIGQTIRPIGKRLTEHQLQSSKCRQFSAPSISTGGLDWFSSTGEAA